MGSPQNNPTQATFVVIVENSAEAAAVTSCWKKKKKNSEDATFLKGLKGRWDDFKNASMDERKACFKNTFRNAFGRSKILGNNHNSKTTKTEDPVPNSS